MSRGDHEADSNEIAKFYTNGCRGKRHYPSKKHANGTIKTMLRKGTVKLPHRLNAYKCKACRDWHIGNR